MLLLLNVLLLICDTDKERLQKIENRNHLFAISRILLQVLKRVYLFTKIHNCASLQRIYTWIKKADLSAIAAA